MQDSNDGNEKDRRYAKEIKTLVRLFGESINEEELQNKIAYHNGNVELVIKDIVQQFVEKESINLSFLSFYLSKKKKTDKLEAERKSKNKLENVEQVIINLFHLFVSGYQIYFYLFK
ncbi:hypothetical protein RFI_15941 [Reticulomyxa filosa]|uniref:Uncharacterized protein n=1 Tax=Reticulomyxa filosa TaxID=46433 RepID=X6N4P6_RETFI|nr:hypothetical protein RFI_15941 [Reticulomyxa filosa]|eukprot:ETO21265.1 hypothetical protein RFI_15941 [Reticulomyxa filosa]